jgi:hypothetical protein
MLRYLSGYFLYHLAPGFWICGLKLPVSGDKDRFKLLRPHKRASSSASGCTAAIVDYTGHRHQFFPGRAYSSRTALHLAFLFDELNAL